jgi:hypothetical protein
VALALYRWTSLVVVRGTTAAVSPSMTTRKWLFSQITVAVLPAWIIPAWIFCRATMSPPREETRRCTVMGPPGWGGRDRPRRAPRSRERLATGTGQAMVRSSVPSWPRTAIKVPSMRSVTRRTRARRGAGPTRWPRGLRVHRGRNDRLTAVGQC